MLQGYYDSCDRFYETPQPYDSVYQKRRKFMEHLVQEYLYHISEEKLNTLKISREAIRHNVRHLYFTDALNYIHPDLITSDSSVTKHIASINYDSEFNRNLKLLGVIPRKTMIRHLFLFGMPDISLDKMNQQLKALGYLPLQETHTLKTGEPLDWLLIQLLTEYDRRKKEMSVYNRSQWMLRTLSFLCSYFDRKGERHLQFLYFKSLKEWCR